MDVVAIQMWFMRAMEPLRTLRDREEGQGLVEYGLILALVSVVVIGILAIIGTSIIAVFAEVVEALGGIVPA